MTVSLPLLGLHLLPTVFLMPSPSFHSLQNEKRREKRRDHMNEFMVFANIILSCKKNLETCQCVRLFLSKGMKQIVSFSRLLRTFVARWAACAGHLFSCQFCPCAWLVLRPCNVLVFHSRVFCLLLILYLWRQRMLKCLI